MQVVSGIQIGTLFNEEFSYLIEAPRGGIMQRCTSMLSSGVDVGALRNEQFCYGRVSFNLVEVSVEAI